jgi:DNA-binding Lrp family transcriptional regulator
MTEEFDLTDLGLLVALERDPRASVTQVADETGLARGTVQTRLDRWQRRSVLRAHSVRVDPASVGFPLSAMVEAELEQHQLDAAVEGLKRIPEVLECFAPAGSTDLLCRVVARDPDDLYRVAEEIRLCPGIVRTRTSVFLRRVIPYRVDRLIAARRKELAARSRPVQG